MRIHFTPADLGKITFAPSSNALAETMTSVHRLHRWRMGMAQPRLGTRRWHREIGGSLEARAGLLFDLIPRRPGGWLPDFLVKPTVSDLADAAELISQTPETQLAADLNQLAPGQKTSYRVRELANGTAGARRALASDLRDYFASSLTPLWSRIQADVVTDRALRSEVLLRGGIDALFATLCPGVRWQPPILHVPSPCASDIHLEGRGLLLLPSYFAIAPVVFHSPDQFTVLWYPMYLGERPNDTTEALGHLLGHTRTAVLASLRASATTTALADRVGISMSSASQHATALRNAGLVSTIRRGIAVEHTLTPLGAALLHGK